MIAFREIDGRKIGYLLADVPDDAPHDIREGIARRNLVALGRTCPCGAEMVLPSRSERRWAARRGEPITVNVEHENDCPAVTSTLLAAFAGWQR